MENTEIEKKFLIDKNTLPFKLSDYPCKIIEQAYLNTNPVVRIRRSDDDYYLTYKGSGMMQRTEYNLPLNKESYEHLLKKADGRIISKNRYLIPYKEFTVELDVFKGDYEGLYLAEVEFETIDQAESFTAPDWFLDDVTMDRRFHNSNMALRDLDDLK